MYILIDLNTLFLQRDFGLKHVTGARTKKQFLLYL